MEKTYSKIGLSFFFIIAILGTLLRLAPFTTIISSYKNILHAHSHVAFQGWVYISLFLLITNQFIDKKIQIKKNYNLQIVLTILTVIGIFISFLLQGYAFFSILFSSLFQLLNYWFVFRFFKDVRQSEISKQLKYSVQFIKASMFLMILSTFGPWIVGVLSAKGLADTEYFNAALYYFFHFQYNGWFIFALFGLFFSVLEKNDITFNQKATQYFFVFSSISIIPSYSLSLLGMSFSSTLYPVAFLSAGLQIISCIFFVLVIKKSIQALKMLSKKWIYLLLGVSFFSFILKNLLQAASCFPCLNSLSFENKYLIIGYIHLIMLGVISSFLISLLTMNKWLIQNKTTYKIGITFFLIGFIFSEVTIVALGFNISFFTPELLAFFSFIIALGIGSLLKNHSSL